MRDTGSANGPRDGDVVLGDDWVIPIDPNSPDMRFVRPRRRLLALHSSTLARKIITFNLIALIILVAGLLWLDDTREDQVLQRASALISEAELAGDVFEARIASDPATINDSDELDIEATLAGLSLRNGVEVFVFDPLGDLAGWVRGSTQLPATVLNSRFDTGPTIISDGLNAVWNGMASILNGSQSRPSPDLAEQVGAMVPVTVESGSRVRALTDARGGTVIVATTPIQRAGQTIAVLAMAGPAGEIDALARQEQERVLQMFVVALLVSVGLSLVLASTIANPLADLAEAAEMGNDHHNQRINPGRIRIPDLSARPDEIGRLSRALRGMVAALYNRIEGNEQFAADVSHEIKNPLASLQSAVGTLRVVKKEEQREKLLEIIEHDVRRLDRLVSDISNASRLDAELVKEDEEPFDMLAMLDNLGQFLGEDARSKGIDYITDMPNEPITIRGLEARLAQVFVNLITNAISFCGEGDAIRVWARRRDGRVLIVVEDTGPGIPDQALTKIFKRFYSQRPEEHFGNNSGLGLAISKQIVEAHGGVIWAENIRPTDADVTSDPLGARFVVALPI